MLGLGRVRRVITGNDEDGKSIVVSDGFSPAIRTTAERPGHYSTEIWRTDGAPASINYEPDLVTGPRQLRPPRNGTVIRVSEMPPESEALQKMDAATASKLLDHASTYKEGGRHPLMHRTETVDYCILLSGELTLILDDSEVTLRAGDMVVQRGTNHAWSNRSGKPCIIAFVLVDGKLDSEDKVD